MSTVLTRPEINKVEEYLRRKFSNPGFELKARKSDDSVEVLLHGEFIGTLYKDEEDGDTCYNFTMAVLDIDLEDKA